MKHIARKFLCTLTKEEFEIKHKGQPFYSQERGEDSKPLNTKSFKNQLGYLATEKDFYIQSFTHNINGKIYLLPEPDPTLIYFSSSQNNLRQADHHKSILLPKLDPQSNISEEVTHDFYNYFGSVCGCIIFLFTSIESFMNSLIKDSDIYERQLKNRTEKYSKKQIEEYLSFDEKIRNVIPQLTQIDFLKSHPLVAQQINNLKEYRDSIVHTKSNKDTFTYDHIVKKSFSFPYGNAIEAVAKYMNGYKQNYITECKCDSDF